MNKWGVRLISVYFFVWAILSTEELIMNPSDAGGFFGIRFGGLNSYNLPFIGSGSFQLDWGALGKVFFLIWVGYSILRFQSPARVAALIVLWPSVIGLGFVLALMTYYAINALVSGRYATAGSSMTFYFFHTKWPGEITNPAIIFLIIAGRFMLAIAPLYILMRKDVKRLFEKSIPSEEPVTILPGETS